jgi:hypothetical protein
MPQRAETPRRPAVGLRGEHALPDLPQASGASFHKYAVERGRIVTSVNSGDVVMYGTTWYLELS